MKFSVLMSVYINESPAYLSECLASLRHQTLMADEVILVEDGAITPELVNVIEYFRVDLNIISVRLESNKGLALALNEGLKSCKYDLIVRMDADDIATPHRFEKQILFMSVNPGIAVSGGFVEEFSGAGVFFHLRRLPLKHNDLVALSKSRSPLSHPAVIFRKASVIMVGGYPNVYPEDYLLWIKIIQAGFEIANISDVLVKMRVGSDFISRRGLRFLMGELRIYKYMYETNYIGLYEYIKVVIGKSTLRASPGFIKKFLYKYMR